MKPVRRKQRMRRMKRAGGRYPGLFLAAIACTACSAADADRPLPQEGADGTPTVEAARVMVTGFAGDAALYADIHSASRDSLVSVAVEGATATLHQMSHADGAMTMVPVAGLAVPAAEGLSLRTGAAHGMVHDLSADVVPGDSLGVTFRFASGHTVLVRAPVVSVSDMLPGSGHTP